MKKKIYVECSVIVEMNAQDASGSVALELARKLHDPWNGVFVIKHDYGENITEDTFHYMKNAIFTD